MRLPRKLKKKAKKERETAEIIKSFDELYYEHFIDRIKNAPQPTAEQWNEAVKRCREQGII